MEPGASPFDSFQFLLGFYWGYLAGGYMPGRNFQFLLGFYLCPPHACGGAAGLSIPFRILHKKAGESTQLPKNFQFLLGFYLLYDFALAYPMYHDFQFLLGFYPSHVPDPLGLDHLFQFLLGFYRLSCAHLLQRYSLLSIPFRILLKVYI